jgi:hypothetical protein
MLVWLELVRCATGLPSGGSSCGNLMIVCAINEDELSGTTNLNAVPHQNLVAKWLNSCFIVVVLQGNYFGCVLKFVACGIFLYTVYGGLLVRWVWLYGHELLSNVVHREQMYSSLK